jgi:cytochrome c oxidase assembly protein subunit 15
MTAGSGVPVGGAPSARFRKTAIAAVVSTYLLVVAGGVVRVSGSGLGCGVKGQDWPLCHGHLVPPADAQTLIEFSHRMLATVSTVLVVLLAVWAWRKYRHLTRVVRATSAVVALLIVQIVLGGATVELKLPGGVVLAHLANALLLLGVLIAAAVALYAPSSRGESAPALSDKQRSAAKQMAWAAAATYALVLSGGVVVANGAGYACAGWPLCGNGFQIDSTHYATINLFHRFVAGVVALLLGWSVARVIRAFKGVRPVRIAAMAVNLALLLQIIAGAVVVETRLPGAARGVHLALASLLWATAALLALLVRPGALRIGDSTTTREDKEQRTPAVAPRREVVPS